MTIRSKTSVARSRFLGGAAATALLAVGLSVPAQALVTPDGVTPASVVDTGNTRPYWVGLAIRNEAGNGGSTCTGLLINPRTVLFAAHCVDGLAPSAYDGNAPGNRAQVGYTTEGTFGRDNIREWLFGQDFPVPAGDARVITASSVNVWYDPRSRNGSAFDPNNGTFLPADVAIAAFDTPNELLGRDAQGGIALLFSQVNSLVPVVLGGFGTSGNGQTGVRTGAINDQYQRRLGNNVLGFLGDNRSLNGTYETGVGVGIQNLLTPTTRFYQDQYFVDFDDPNRATRPFFNGPGSDPLCVSTNLNCRLDFDVFPGAAVAGEAITGSGDSGSPLVTGAFGREVSLGVLSSGNRFFFDSLGNVNDNLVRFTDFSNYGTTAGYNPLFLFWDQIVVNNPYKYVTAAAGDGEWTNPARWTQEIDPLYMTLSGSTLVNALPATPALGSSGATPNVGALTNNPSPAALCAFTGTCDGVSGSNQPMPGSEALPGEEALPGQIGLPGLETLDNGESLIGDNTPVNQSGDGEQVIGDNPTQIAQGVTALWSSGTLIAVNSGALTGPGSTGFIPDNTNGTAGLQNSANFFEVNLRSAGTTFLTGTTVTIDRLNLRGATSGLNVRSGATLNTTITSFVDNGTLTVNGTFAPRQLMVLGGKVMGAGSINTVGGVGNVAGRIAPGNSIGTLTVAGPYVQSAAGVFEVEVTNGSADLLIVNGAASLAGTIDVKTFGASPLKGQVFTVLNATGGRSGTFGTVLDNITGLLRPTVSYTANTVVVTISAPTFCEAAPGAPLCGFLDGLDGATTPAMQAQIQALQNLDTSQVAGALASINPSRVNGQASLGFQFADLIKMQLGHRSSELLWQGMGGNTSAMLRATTQVASTGASADIIASAALAAMQTSASDAAFGRSGWSLFAAGDIGSADTQNTSGVDEVEAQAFTAGADYSTGNGAVAGFAVSALDGEIDQSYGFGGNTKADGYAGSVYAGFANSMAAFDVYLSYSMQDYETNRTVMTAPLTFVNARGETDGSLLQFGATLNVPIATPSKMHGVTISAVGGGYYGLLNIDGYTETGAGGWSVLVSDREHESFKAQAGLEFSRPFTFAGGLLTPFVRVQANSELIGDGIAFTGSFTAAPASTFTVATPELGDFWGSVALGATAQMGSDSTIYVRYQNEFNRDGQEANQVSLAARFGF